DFYCLEANNLPGMTPNSLIPQEARAVGITYEDLCEKLVLSASRKQ
ncbi:MAG: D-alanine--D-alanine ligase, partial [Butyrivibrio hungatei]|nr:D-alanine--D-alanine ligase [Butyrivibrio hungatei]